MQKLSQNKSNWLLGKGMEARDWPWLACWKFALYGNKHSNALHQRKLSHEEEGRLSFNSLICYILWINMGDKSGMSLSRALMCHQTPPTPYGNRVCRGLWERHWAKDALDFSVASSSSLIKIRSQDTTSWELLSWKPKLNTLAWKSNLGCLWLPLFLSFELCVISQKSNALVADRAG